MKRKSFLLIKIFAIIIAFLIVGPAFSSDRVTIIGVVTDDQQIVTDDDEVYEIYDNGKGSELISNVGMRVKVTGTVENDEDSGNKIITVISFQVIDLEAEEEL